MRAAPFRIVVARSRDRDLMIVALLRESGSENYFPKIF
jgi:hypothetical protein